MINKYSQIRPGDVVWLMCSLIIAAAIAINSCAGSAIPAASKSNAQGAGTSTQSGMSAKSATETMMIKPIVPWPGGKRKLAKHILPLIEARPHTCYCEPFAGAAAILMAKEPSKVEALNDINGDLINLYRCVQHHFAELHAQFKWLLISREHWDRLQATSPESLTDIQKAAKFLYLQRLSFGARVDGQTFGYARTSAPKLNLLTLERDLEAAHLRLARAYIENLPWQTAVAKYDSPDTLFYFDPPYWQTSGYGVPFEWSEYEQLAETLKTMKGQFILSIGDHPDIRELLAEFTCIEVDYQYTNGHSKQPRKTIKELIYHL